MDSSLLLSEQSMYYNKNQVNGIFTSYDNSLLSIATNSGFKLYKMDTFSQVSEDDGFQYDIIGPIKLAIPFYQSHLIFIIGKNNTTKIKDNQLVIWNDFKKKKEATLTFKEQIINAKISKEGIFVAFEKYMVIYDIISLIMMCSITNVSYMYNKSINMSMNKDTLILLNISLENSSVLNITKIKCDNYQLKAKLDISIKTPFKSIYKMALNDKGTLALIVGNPKNRIHIYSIESLEMLYCFRLENPFTQLISISLGKKDKFVSVFYSDCYLEIYQIREGHKKKCKCLDNIKNSLWEKTKGIFKAKQQYFAKYKFEYTFIDYFLSSNLYSNENTNGFIVKFIKMSELIIIDSHGITEKIKFNSKEKGIIWAYKEIIWKQDNKLIKGE